MQYMYELFAQDGKIDPSTIGIPDVTDADAAISGLLTTVYGAAGMLCVVIIIIAAYMYTTSSGEAATIKRAKEAIFGAIIGLIVIMMAFVITQFVIGRF
jgi:hypothetical protein